MIEYYVEFPNFDAASMFAFWAASPSCYDAEVKVRHGEQSFQVVIPRAMTLDLACQYIYSRCRGCFPKKPTADILAVLEPEFSIELQSSSLAWVDPLSGLTWDVARYFMQDWPKEHPDNSADIMNAVCYAGYEDWRLPTRDEIKTLGNSRYLNLGILSNFHLVKYRKWIIDLADHKPFVDIRPRMLNLWSSEMYGNDSDDYIGVNLHDLIDFWQGYSEEDSEYHYRAKTVMVRGGPVLENKK